MSFGSFNGPLYARKWKPGVSRYPVRWIAYDEETGVVLEESTAIVAPKPRRPGVLVVPARLPGVPR